MGGASQPVTFDPMGATPHETLGNPGDIYGI